MKKEIVELRKVMNGAEVDLYYACGSDPHGSEFIADHYKSCEFLSGLLAENQELVVTDDEACVWTDSRFFLQAEKELKGSGIKLMRSGVEGVPTVIEYIKSRVIEFGGAGGDKSEEANNTGYFVIGFDGTTVPSSTGLKFEEEFAGLLPGEDENGYERVKLSIEDLVGGIWEDRPPLIASEIWDFPLGYAGKGTAEKLRDVRLAMKEKGADYLLLSDLMEIAWLFNLRGSDVECTPVFYSYAIIGETDAHLYVIDPVSLKDKGLPAEIYSIEHLYSHDIMGLDIESSLWMDPDSANYSIRISVPCEKVIEEPTPISMMKSVKNETEREHAKIAHIKDGVAVTKFIKWLKEIASDSEGRDAVVDPKTGEPVTEITAADYLEERRREEGCFDLSFPTISAFGENAAIVHYEPKAGECLTLEPKGFLLVDSGGQYMDGTTDITRTIALGPLTEEMIDNYTYVLKGHIALSRFVIKSDTVNKELDDAARDPLRATGIDFGHGVSHGVGHVLSVHEGPAGVKKNEELCAMKPGMIISNEPGYYKGGEYGIRIENLILLKAGASEGTIESEPLTCVPYERAAINKALLTEEEIKWIDSYHEWVREMLTPLLDEETSAFVREATEPL